MAHRNPLPLSLLLLLALVLAACGAPAEPLSPAELRAGAAEADAAEQAPAGPANAAAVAAPDASPGDGIEQGFTAEGRAYRGDPDASVVLEEFSDFQCPFCGRFTAETMPGLLENQIAAGEVLLVYHDFPLESIHPQAFAAAHAARCAGDQGADAYWQMHDLLYERMSAWGVNNPGPVFLGMAEELGLDTAVFSACQEGQEHAAAIRADIEYGLSQGIRSTPSFLVNGQPLVGAQPLAAFEQAIAAVRDGEELVQAPPQQEEVLPPARVAPTPAAIPAANFAAALGDPQAPVTIIEFTDYQCPFCARHALETLPQLLTEQIETGRVYYMLKDLPLENIHPNARAAAKAARCAGEQDAYWEMHDALFTAQESWGSGNLPSAIFTDLAASLELDRAAFDACMDDDRHTQAIQQNLDEALSLEANSTPFFFIDGYPVPGAQPYELFAYAIDLAEAGDLARAYAPPDPDLSAAFAIGDAEAPVTIVEYTDFQCPFCSRYHEQSFGQIVENFVDTGLVRYVFKDFPLTNIHPQAVLAASAARCAGEQDARLEMYTQLFAQQSAWSGRADAADLFKSYAADLGLDTEAFAECLDSGRQEAAVQADLEEGMALGINGTPAFILNGRPLSGAQPYQVFEQAINQLLEEAGAGG